jgi:hypothetical protein
MFAAMENSDQPAAQLLQVADALEICETAEELLSALYAKMTLPREQVDAIAAIMAGNTPTAAARAAGVHRATLYRWMKDDADFARALAECRAAGRFAVQERLLAMSDDCIDVVERAIHDGNAMVALRLMKLTGIFNFAPARSPETGGEE